MGVASTLVSNIIAWLHCSFMYKSKIKIYIVSWSVCQPLRHQEITQAGNLESIHVIVRMCTLWHVYSQ